MARSVKPRVGETDVRHVLTRTLGDHPVEITRITSGKIASTFECVVGSATYIVQFNESNMASGASKETFLLRRLDSVGVPVRALVTEGDWGDLRYTVAHKAEGIELHSLAPGEFEKALPSVFGVLTSMRTVNLDDTTGFGWFNGEGRGGSGTWKAHLTEIAEEEPGHFYDRWHALFESTFLERSRYESYVARMTELLESFVAPRELVHGGFGYGNVLVEKGRITAVLDWQDARIGDGLFDVAYLDFWPTQHDLSQLYQEHCSRLGMRFDSYAERIACYKYYIAADAMRFFAKTDNRDAYESVVQIAESIEE